MKRLDEQYLIQMVALKRINGRRKTKMTQMI